ncbi:hypothetical protein SLS60_001411 [Paraconiothyrium brasiliense]|uniref:Uncharacterized protein n=1 Tax=Paraconiothyrium brasiliense TaxID=300254 RepID=A0ABR3S928_9PLEO
MNGRIATTKTLLDNLNSVAELLWHPSEIIHNQSPALQESDHHGSDPRDTERWREEAMAIALAVVSRVQRDDYLWRLRCYNPKDNSWNPDQDPLVHKIHEVVENIGRMLCPLTQSDLPKKIQEVHEWVSERQDLENTIIRTDDDHLGIARDTVRKGDLLVRFDIDEAMQFVVRQTGHEMYEIVSMAFVPRLAKDPSNQSERAELTLC